MGYGNGGEEHVCVIDVLARFRPCRGVAKDGRPAMRRLTHIFPILAIVFVAGPECCGDVPDAAELARLIDRGIESRLSREGLQPAGLADDAEFLRRVYLDLHGVIPTRERAERFLADTDSAKRARLVDALLASPRYGEFLADVWQSYLISPLADDQPARAERLRRWLAGQFNASNWDGIARALLTATGKLEDKDRKSVV